VRFPDRHPCEGETKQLPSAHAMRGCNAEAKKLQRSTAWTGVDVINTCVFN
jgi:hypothetical protein